VFAPLHTGDTAAPPPGGRDRTDGFSPAHWGNFVDACALLYLNPLKAFVNLATGLDVMHARRDGEIGTCTTTEFVFVMFCFVVFFFFFFPSL
jgi:hypothetical protein